MYHPVIEQPASSDKTQLAAPRAATNSVVPALLHEQRWRTTGVLWLFALPLLLFLLLPLVALILCVDPVTLPTNLVNPQVQQAVSLSLLTTGISTWLALLFGTPLAYLLARRQFRGRATIDTLSLPAIFPVASKPCRWRFTSALNLI